MSVLRVALELQVEANDLMLSEAPEFSLFVITFAFIPPVPWGQLLMSDLFTTGLQSSPGSELY